MYVVGAVRNVSHNYSSLKGVWCRSASGTSASEAAQETEHQLRVAAAQQIGLVPIDHRKMVKDFEQPHLSSSTAWPKP